MNRWKRLLTSLRRGHVHCPKCDVRLRLTGKPPSNPGEELISRAAGGRGTVSLHWLEDKLADLLFRAESGRGAWLLDIGVWGRAACREEASRIIAEADADFLLIMHESETEHGSFVSLEDEEPYI